MTVALPVHPFPARMAPELALERLPMRLDGGLRVLDPMMGSGTIPVLAALHGYSAVGFDSDPLAVLIARTNGRKLPPEDYLASAERVVESARATRRQPWTHHDRETQEFIDFWFDSQVQPRLAALARAIDKAPSEFTEALWCAFSRLIITKDAGASRARDVSHSRPHRVRNRASFDPVARFLTAANAVVQRHRQVSATRPAASRLRLEEGDARRLPLKSNTVDIVMTSPPYLQAIDYLRGHRMSLVWMGYTIGQLRELRGESIGSERGQSTSPHYADLLDRALEGSITRRARSILNRYMLDLDGVLGEIQRVLRETGQATLVVADATLEGRPVAISTLVRELAVSQGLVSVSDQQRAIPTGRRYLPPPKAGGDNALDRRMRIEHSLTFAKA